MSLLGGIAGIVGSIGGLIGAGKSNKLNAEQLKLSREAFEEQKKYSAFMKAMADQLLGLGVSYTGSDGSTGFFDTKTGATSSTLGPARQKLQDASNAEELRRLTLDQAMRRRGMQDAEINRSRETTNLRSLDRTRDGFNQGYGQVDGSKLGSQLRTNRMSAVNAGYDDTAKAATSLGVRTGNASIEDALTNMSRDRIKDYAQIGSPELEAMNYADTKNSNTLGEIVAQRKEAYDNSNEYQDSAFNSAPYTDIANANLMDLMKLDLGRREVAMGGTGAAAANIGNAAAGMRQGYNQWQKNQVHNKWGDFAAGLSESLGQLPGFGG